MALTCGHKSLLEINDCYYWDTCKAFGQINKQHEMCIPFNYDDGQTEVCVTCDSKDHKDDFEIFTWLEDAKDQITGGSKNHAKKINQNTLVNWSPHYLIHCIIVYAKECPYCKSAREELEDIDSLRKQIDELKKQTEKSDRLKRKAEEERDDETRKIRKMHDGAQELKEQNDKVHKELQEEVSTLTAVQKQQSEKITELETTNREALEKISSIQAERDSLFAESLQSGMGLYMFAVQSKKLELKNECVKSLRSKLTMQTAPKLFILSVKCNDKELTQLVINYAEQNGGKLQLTKSPELKKLLKEDVALFTRVFETLTS